MAQHYQLTSLDAREVRLDRKSPEDWLFNGPVPELINFLSVPVVPSLPIEDIDPSSTITGQKRKRSLSDNTSYQKRQKIQRQDALPKTPTGYLTISTLPTEVIGAIFYLLTMDDTLRLASASRKLWKIGWYFMDKKLMGFMSPWAGHRLACFGEVVEDYPPGMLYKDEEVELSKGLDSDSDSESNTNAGELINLSTLIEDRYEKAEFGLLLNTIASSLRGIALNEMPTMPTSAKSRIFAFTDFTPHSNSQFFPDNHQWVLRNLTTHEFVRASALTGNLAQPGRHMPSLGFEHIILSRIFWSSSSEGSAINGMDISRGDWAGHRLEITTLDRHRADEERWRDVGEEAVEGLQELWRESGGWNGEDQSEEDQSE